MCVAAASAGRTVRSSSKRRVALRPSRVVAETTAPWLWASAAMRVAL
jgi:hypothetical protein